MCVKLITIIIFRHYWIWYYSLLATNYRIFKYKYINNIIMPRFSLCKIKINLVKSTKKYNYISTNINIYVHPKSTTIYHRLKFPKYPFAKLRAFYYSKLLQSICGFLLINRNRSCAANKHCICLYVVRRYAQYCAFCHPFL